MSGGSMRLTCMFLALVLSACGGGGNDDSDPDGGATTSGLIPVPPAPGITLYADASDLRPIKDGATWNYQGTKQAIEGDPQIAYASTTTQSSSSPTAAIESTTNSGNSGPSTQPISVLGGTVSNAQTVDFAGRGRPQTIDFIELRSPVREGDQYTIVDQRYTDTAIDADGDGRADWLYVGIYSTVLDTTMVSIAGLAPVQAVRVKSVAVSRVRYSSNGQLSSPVQGTLETWYVPGLGIVRQITKTPSAVGNGIATADEQLTSWSGLPP